MMRIFLLLTFALVFNYSCKSPAQSTLDEIESLGLNIYEDIISTFYSDGHEERAKEIIDLLRSSTDYFYENFQVSQTFSVAVLDSIDWITITPIPYGLPFVSGPPYIVCIPATSDNVLAATVSEGLAKADLNTLYSITKENFVNRFISLIGFHELGHMYARDFGISFPNKWIDEFAASYFAYCYLKDEQPTMCQLWLDASEILLNELNPKYTSISAFEELYVQVGVENYAWYQMVFLLRVREVYNQNGKKFLKIMKNHNWSDNTSNQYLDDMENLNSGFEIWAREQGLTE